VEKAINRHLLSVSSKRKTWNLPVSFPRRRDPAEIVPAPPGERKPWQYPMARVKGKRKPDSRLVL
jgi:hypothetical protein